MGTLSLPRAVLPPWRALCLYAWSIGVRVVQKYLRYKEELANYPKILLSEDSRKLPVPGHAFRLKGQDPLVWLPQRTVASYGLTPCSDFGTRPGSSSCASLPRSLPDLHPLFLLYFLLPEFWHLCEAFHVSQCHILFKAKWSLSECAVPLYRLTALPQAAGTTQSSPGDACLSFSLCHLRASLSLVSKPSSLRARPVSLISVS